MLRIHDYIRRMGNSFEHRLDIVDLIEYFYILQLCNWLSVNRGKKKGVAIKG